MIRPKQITNFNRTRAELEELILFSLIIQGKNSEIQAVKLEHFLVYLAHVTGAERPFEMVNIALHTEDDEDGETLLLKALQKFGLGQYGRLMQAFGEVIYLHNLAEVTTEQLEACFGIGPKSSRFFIMHSRAESQIACLDTHILKWLGSKGHKVPKNTPQGAEYQALEKVFLFYCAVEGKTPAEMDLAIWTDKSENSSRKNLTTV